MNFVIERHCRIAKNCINLNGQLLFELTGIPFIQFADSAYLHFQTNYPKFHKMDNLCKLGFLGAEILLKHSKLNATYNPYEIGVTLSNQSSSLDTDLRHHKQVQDGLPSPAVFVYSLPNIVIGEICIRHGIKGENVFFISNNYNIPNQVTYIRELLEAGVVKACLGGWVELLGDHYELFMYLVESETDNPGLPFTENQIEKLYHQTE